MEEKMLRMILSLKEMLLPTQIFIFVLAKSV